MKVVSSFEPYSLTWYRTTHDDHEALWVTDWHETAPGAWIVVLDRNTYLRPNLSVHEAYERYPELAKLWGAVSREYMEAKDFEPRRQVPGCGALALNIH